LIDHGEAEGSFGHYGVPISISLQLRKVAVLGGQMQLIDPKVIGNGEERLFQVIGADLNFETIAKVFKDNYYMTLMPGWTCTRGGITIYSDMVAYRLTFDAKVTMSILVDRTGRYLALGTSHDVSELPQDRPKITSLDVISKGEKGLLDAIKSGFDWGALQKIFRDKYVRELPEDMTYTNGDIIAYNDIVAYRLDFKARVSVSVLLDRLGNYLGLKTSCDRSESFEESDIAATERVELDSPFESTDESESFSLLDRYKRDTRYS
jgi:hypothetical protein